MELQIENIIAAYNTADDNSKNLLRTMFPNVEFEGDKQADNRPVTERIKSYEDACRELGIKPIDTRVCNQVGDLILDDNTIAYMKLRTIVEALNEGWKPEFTKDEWRYYPWFYLYTQAELDGMSDWEKQERRMIDTAEYVTEYAGFGYAYSAYDTSKATARVSSRLCLHSRELAMYCGKQFIGIWADFNLIRK